MIKLYSKTLPKESMVSAGDNANVEQDEYFNKYLGREVSASGYASLPEKEVDAPVSEKEGSIAKPTTSETIGMVVTFNKARVSFSGRNEIVKRKIQSKQDTFANYGTIKELWAKPDDSIIISGELFNDSDMNYPMTTMNKLLTLLRGGSSGEELYFSGTSDAEGAKRISGQDGEDLKVVVSSYSFGEPIAGYRQPFRIELLTDLANYDFLEE